MSTPEPILQVSSVLNASNETVIMTCKLSENPWRYSHFTAQHPTLQKHMQVKNLIFHFSITLLVSYLAVVVARTIIKRNLSDLDKQNKHATESTTVFG